MVEGWGLVDDIVRELFGGKSGRAAEKVSRVLLGGSVSGVAGSEFARYAVRHR